MANWSFGTRKRGLMEFIKEIYELTFIYRYLNDYMSLGLFLTVTVVGFNYVIIRDILIKDNPLYVVIFWISASISIVFPGLYIKLLLFSYSYMPLEYFNYLNKSSMIFFLYIYILIPIIYVLLYILYFIFHLFRSRFFTKDNFYRIRGSQKNWDASVPNTILHIILTILVFGTLARYLFIILYAAYGEEGTKIPTTDIILGGTKAVSKDASKGVTIIPEYELSDDLETDSSDFVSQEEIDAYIEAQYKDD